MTMRRPSRAFGYWHESVLAVFLLGILAGAWILDPTFVEPATQTELATHILETALIAVPMTLVLITGGIDLSVGSSMALSAVVLGLSFEAGLPLWLCSVLSVVTGSLCGALNGVFIARVRVHPLIVTLATLSAFRGIAEGISQGRPISGFPESFAALGDGPAAATAFGLAALGAGVALLFTAPGRWIRAVGFNETTCRFSAVPVDRLKMVLYALSGASAGLAALLFVARRNTAKADIGSGLELEVITAVVLGGTSVLGGRGTILGTVLGLAIVHELREFVSWQWHADELILIVTGALLVGSVLLNTALSRRRE